MSIEFDSQQAGRYTFGAVPDDKNKRAAAPEKSKLPAKFHAHEAATEATQAIEEVGEVTIRLANNIFVGFFVYIGEVVILLGQTIRSIPRINAGDLVRQMSVIGVDTIPIAVLTVGFSGGVLSLYISNTLHQYGVPNLVGGIVGLSILRETGPVLAGVVAAARAGSAMTAEIGSMTVTEQIDALRSMAISPVEYLVAPRIVASLIMLPILTVFADAAGLFGGAWVSASTTGVSYAAFFESIHQFTGSTDVLRGLLKTIVFGIIISVIGCREGMRTQGGAAGVGQSTTRSVVFSIVLVFIANFILSFVLFDSNLI